MLLEAVQKTNNLQKENLLDLLELEMKSRGFSNKTIWSYAFHVGEFLKNYKGENPAEYFVSLAGKLDPKTINLRISAVKFFFRYVLKKEIELNYMKRPKRLPEVLTQEEILRMFEETKNPKHLLILKMLYGCGLRLSEVRNLKKDDQQKEILELLGKIVEKYEGSASIAAWQVENEPLFPFGECPWRDKNFLKKEIELVKSLDGIRRPVVVSDSGEFSLWFSAAGAGDIVGITMYEKTWFKELKAYVKYPLPPVFYWRKANIIKKLFDKDVIVIELQAEPWCPNLLYNCGLEEQEKTMNLEQFKKNVEFAGKTGLKEFYLWGAEWWHWLKEKQQRPEIWEEAEKLFL